VRIDELLDSGRGVEDAALAVPSTGNLFSSVMFHDHARDRASADLGCEVYMAPEAATPRAAIPARPRTNLILLARPTRVPQPDQAGVGRYMEGFYYKPRSTGSAGLSMPRGSLD